MTSNSTNIFDPMRTEAIITGAFSFGLSTFAVCARIYTKSCLSRKVRLEDYYSVLAWLTFKVYILLGSVVLKNGGNIKYTAYMMAIDGILYCLIIIIVKSSILLQYITVFVPQPRSPFHYAVHVLIWTNILFYTMMIIVSVSTCPPTPNWGIPVDHARCMIRYKVWVASGSFNLLSDFLILILPFPLIWRLQIPRDKKFWIMVVFGLGLLACIASAFRLICSIFQPFGPGYTYLINTLKVGLWSSAEIAIGIIVGCLPVLPRFFRRFYPSKNFSSNLGALPQIGGGRPSWRRFFRKFITPSASSAETRGFSRRFFSSKKARSKAPYISTLNFAGDTFHMTEGDFPKIPSACKAEALPASTAPGFGGDEDTAYRNPDDVEMDFPIPGNMKTVSFETESRAASNA